MNQLQKRAIEEILKRADKINLNMNKLKIDENNNGICYISNPNIICSESKEIEKICRALLEDL